MDGATKAIKEYYSGYNSPYVKAIEEGLKGKEFGSSLELPDVIAKINDSLSAEIDNIANAAIAQTFIPLVKRILTREDSEIRFSDILRKFVDTAPEKGVELIYEFEVSVEKSTHGWLDVTLSSPDREYRVVLHKNHASKADEKEKYIILSLPYPSHTKEYHRTMRVKMEDAIIEMPLTGNLLQDEFISYIARLCMCRSVVTVDATDFDESMFEQHCHC